jgi:hypothetical protein
MEPLQLLRYGALLVDELPNESSKELLSRLLLVHVVAAVKYGNANVAIFFAKVIDHNGRHKSLSGTRNARA